MSESVAATLPSPLLGFDAVAALAAAATRHTRVFSVGQRVFDQHQPPAIAKTAASAAGGGAAAASSSGGGVEGATMVGSTGYFHFSSHTSLQTLVS